MKNKLLSKYSALPIHLRASVWYFICAFLQKGISVITTPIFTRLLSAAEFGRYNVFNSWLSILSIIITLALYGGVYEQGVIKFDKERDVFSSSLQGLLFTMVLAWTFLYLLFREFWNQLFSLTTVQMLAMLLMIWATGVYNLWATEQRVRLSYRKFVIITALVTAAKPIVGIIFVVTAEDKVTARILGLALVEFVAYAWMFAAQMRRGKKFFSRRFWKYVIGFNLPLVPHYLSQTVLSSADRIMISNMISEDAAGIYSLAYSISMIMLLFNTALSQTITPWVMQKIKDGKVKETESVAYVSLSIMAGVNLILIAFAPEAVALFAPVSYHNAIWIIPPIAMSVYFIYAYNLFSNIEFYYEKTKSIMTASMLAAVTNIVLNYCFIKIFGYYAAGYTTLFCYAINAAAHYLFMEKICRTQMDGLQVYDPKIIGSITGLFLGIGFIYIFSYNSVVVRYIITLILLTFAFIKRKDVADLIKNVIKKRKQF